MHDGADMSDPHGIERMMRRCADELGGPDILVNNAGIQHVSPVEDFPAGKWDAIIAINSRPCSTRRELAFPAMKQKGWGRIINTASAHSLVASPNKSAYVAAKHGVAGFTKAVALEAARDGVTVNCISPGYVWTPLVERQIPDTMKTRGMTREQVMNDVLLAAQPTKRFVTPEEVAEFAVFLCERGGAVDHRRQPQHGRWLDGGLGSQRCALPRSCLDSSPSPAAPPSGGRRACSQPQPRWPGSRRRTTKSGCAVAGEFVGAVTQERRLAAPGRSDERGDGLWLDGHRDVVDRLEGSVVRRDVVRLDALGHG